MNRRHFLQIAGAALALPVLGQFLSKKANAEGRGGGAAASNFVDPKSDQAKSFFYVENHKDITKADLKKERSGVKFEQQTCSNCALFNNGTCPLFAGKQVKPTAWCNSWAKK